MALLLLSLAFAAHGVELPSELKKATAEQGSADQCRTPIVPSLTVGLCNSTANIVNANDVIQIFDTGDGRATVVTTLGGLTTNFVIFPNSPQRLIYGKQCNFLWASIVAITFSRSNGTVAFNPNNINTYLTILGLNTVQVLSGALTVQLTHTPLSPLVNISPVFFGLLQQAQAVTIQECQDCVADSNIPPITPRLAALPGFTQNYVKSWNFNARSGAQTSIFIKNTAFSNIGQTFPSLACSPGNFQIIGNTLLASLNGLSNVQTTIVPGPTVFISNNPLLVAATSVSQLRLLAGCSTGQLTSPLFSGIQISTASCVSTCWNQYCSFTNTGLCTPCAPPPSPPPSPPPPSPPPPLPGCNTPISPTIAPVCGSLFGFLSIADNGDGTCSAFRIEQTSAGAPSTTFPLTCTALAYPGISNCASIQSAVKITIRRLRSVTYVAPDINKWLTNMGVATAVVIANALTVEVDHSPFVIPPFISPTFFTFLKQVEAVVVQECANCAISTNVGPTVSALAALPGLRSIQQFRGFKGGVQLGSLIIKSTALPDLLSFSGISCTPGFIQITNNPRLGTFNGLEGARSFFSPGPTVFAQGNPLLNFQSVSAIKQLAGCPTGLTSPLNSTFFVITAVCVLPSWNTYCTFVNTPGQCVPAPSPPPPPPPPANVPPPPPSPPKSPPPPSPPSPPPPPPVSCAPEVSPADICGIDAEAISFTIQVQFIGNGTCLTRVFYNGSQATLTPAQASCQATLFPGETCRTIRGNLYLFVTNQVNADAATFVQPRFDIALAALGIGSVSNIEYVLSLVVDHSPFPIPVPLAPVFLQTLRTVFTIQVIESVDFGLLPDVPPPVPQLVGLPGLAFVQKIIAPITTPGFADFTTFKIQGTAMNDLSSFASLVCSANNINITNNFFMDSLTGLTSLATWDRQFGPNVVITGNNFTTRGSVSALSNLAGCPTTQLLNNVFTEIQVIGCSFITSWTTYCAYLSTGVCVAAPPPPISCFDPPAPNTPVCGGNQTIIDILDYGDGTCTATIQTLSPPTTKSVSCSSLAYGVQCGSLNGSLTLTAFRANNATAYRGPFFNNWLSLMGLQNINVIGGNFIVLMNQLVNTIPAVTPADFLPRLVLVVGSLTANEFRRPSQTPSLLSVPGFKTVVFAQSAIQVNGTGLSDFRNTFNGLICAPFQFFLFTNNPNLRSFIGLDSLTQPPFLPRVPDFTAPNTNPLLNTIDAIYNYAGCPSGLTGTTVGVNSIYVRSCPSLLTTFQQICNFIATGQCP